MSENKHTPWKITKFADGTVGIHAPDGTGWLEVAVLRGRFAQDHARLIAAAPDLLEALQVIRMSAGWDHLSGESQDLIAAALSKAQGTQS